MKKIIFSLLTIFCGFLMVACGNSNMVLGNNLENQMKKLSNQLDSYSNLENFDLTYENLIDDSIKTGAYGFNLTNFNRNTDTYGHFYNYPYNFSYMNGYYNPNFYNFDYLNNGAWGNRFINNRYYNNGYYNNGYYRTYPSYSPYGFYPTNIDSYVGFAPQNNMFFNQNAYNAKLNGGFGAQSNIDTYKKAKNNSNNINSNNSNKSKGVLTPKNTGNNNYFNEIDFPQNLEELNRFYQNKVILTQTENISQNACDACILAHQKTANLVWLIENHINYINKLAEQIKNGEIEIDENQKICINDLLNNIKSLSNKINIGENELKNEISNVNSLKQTESGKLNAKYIRLQNCINTKNCYLENIISSLCQIENIINGHCLNIDFQEQYYQCPNCDFNPNQNINQNFNDFNKNLDNIANQNFNRNIENNNNNRNRNDITNQNFNNSFDRNIAQDLYQNENEINNNFNKNITNNNENIDENFFINEKNNNLNNNNFSFDEEDSPENENLQNSNNVIKDNSNQDENLQTLEISTDDIVKDKLLKMEMPTFEKGEYLNLKPFNQTDLDSIVNENENQNNKALTS